MREKAPYKSSYRRGPPPYLKTFQSFWSSWASYNLQATAKKKLCQMRPVDVPVGNGLSLLGRHMYALRTQQGLRHQTLPVQECLRSCLGLGRGQSGRSCQTTKRPMRPSSRARRWASHKSACCVDVLVVVWMLFTCRGLGVVARGFFR